MNTENKLIANLEKVVSGTPETAKVRDLALTKLKHLGFPTRKNEEYKYSPISRLVEGFTPKSAGKHAYSKAPDLGAADTFIFVNGAFKEGLSVSDYKVSFKQAEASDLTVSAQSEDSYELLNTIISEQILEIEIPANTSVSKPIVIVHAFAGTEQEVSQARIRIHAKAGSKASIVEFHTTDAVQSCYTNNMTEVSVDSNSHLTLTRIGNERDSVRVSNTRVEQQGDSVFTSINVDLQGNFLRNNLRTVQHGSNCETNMYGLYLAKGAMHVDNHTSIDHTHPHSESNELYKGILKDQATGVFNGKIFVRQEAQKTNAFQQNNNILLSEDATINTKPQLEIWADDVKCSHGCTTGQLDSEQIFYLRSRGLGISEATALLLEGFALEVIEKIPDASVRDEVAKTVLQTLHE